MKLAKVLQQKPPVIERYIRFRAYRLSKQIVRAVMRRVLYFRERKKQKALIPTSKILAKYLGRNHHGHFETNRVLLNVGLFFLIAERDIQSVKIDALTHPDPWRRSLSARIILLTIHELDLDTVTGGKLRDALSDSGIPEEVRREVAESLRDVRSAQGRARKKFAFLRNSTIAHRHPDARLQYRAIVHLDERDVFTTAAEFYTAIHRFNRILPKLMLEAAKWPSLMNQIRAYEQREGKVGESRGA